MCLNVGTPKSRHFTFGTNENVAELAVPILKHFRVTISILIKAPALIPIKGKALSGKLYCTGTGPSCSKLTASLVNFRAGPRTLECRGGGASGPDPEQSNTGYDVSGGSGKGGEYERGSPPVI